MDLRFVIPTRVHRDQVLTRLQLAGYKAEITPRREGDAGHPIRVRRIEDSQAAEVENLVLTEVPDAVRCR